LNLKELNRTNKFSQTFSRFCLDLTYLYVETQWTNSQIQDDVLELIVNRINAGLKYMYVPFAVTIISFNSVLYLLGRKRSFVCSLGGLLCSWSDSYYCVRAQLICHGTRAETIFRLSAKRTSPFKWAGASVQSTAGSRGVRISGSNAGYTMFRGSVEGTGYPLYSPVSPSLPLPCVTVCRHISIAVYSLVLMSNILLRWITYIC